MAKTSCLAELSEVNGRHIPNKKVNKCMYPNCWTAPLCYLACSSDKNELYASTSNTNLHCQWKFLRKTNQWCKAPVIFVDACCFSVSDREASLILHVPLYSFLHASSAIPEEINQQNNREERHLQSRSPWLPGLSLLTHEPLGDRSPLMVHLSMAPVCRLVFVSLC